MKDLEHRWKPEYFRLIEMREYEAAIRLLVAQLSALDSAFVNADGRYFDRELDESLKKVSDEVFKGSDIQGAAPFTPKSILHIASALYDRGGHTGVIIDYVQSMPDYSHEIVVDDVPEVFAFQAASTRVFAHERIEVLRGLGCKVTILTGTLLDRLRQIHAIGARYEFLLLHHHPWDPLPVIAAHAFPRKVILELHADNSLTLGLSSGWDVACYRGLAVTFLQASLPGNPFYLIPLTSFQEGVVLPTVQDGPPWVTATAGSNVSKVIPFESSDYWEFIGELVSRFDVTHYHIGPVNPTLVEMKRTYTEKYPKLKERMIFDIPRSDLAETSIRFAHLYIDSFPIGGGKTVVDALALGIPAVVIPNGFNDFLTNIEYAETCEMGFRGFEDFSKWFTRFEKENAFRLETRRKVKTFYETNHSRAALSSALNAMVRGEAPRVSKTRAPVIDLPKSKLYAAEIDRILSNGGTQSAASFGYQCAKRIYKILRGVPGVETSAIFIKRKMGR